MKLSKKLFMLSSTLIAPVAIATPAILSSCSEEDPNKLFTWNMNKSEIDLKWINDWTSKETRKATVEYSFSYLFVENVESFGYPEMPDEKELAYYLSIMPDHSKMGCCIDVNFAIGWAECEGTYIYSPLIPITVKRNGKSKTYKVKMPPLIIHYYAKYSPLINY